jgi:Aldehyde:ferredoxin oxidoreductase
MITDGVGGCLYGEMFGTHHWNPAKYMNAAAGWDYSNQQYMDIGKRIQTTRQLFNAKHGIDIPSVKLPERMEGKPALTEGPLKGKTLSNEENIAEYWRIYGWDNATGIPKKETLTELGLDKFLAEGGNYGC